MNASQKSVVTGGEHYATALAVCTSGSGRIKGVRLWYARIRANRALERAPTPNSLQRTNCSNWHAPQQCGARQVIVGIRAHYTDRQGYTGLSIRCGRIARSRPGDPPGPRRARGRGKGGMTP